MQMNRDLLWVVVALTATFGGAYLNERYNLANPEMEKKLIGCWAGSTGSGSFMSGASVLQINTDGTFSETGIEKFLDKPKFVSGAGSWKLHKDRLTLSYNESTATVLFPRAGRSLKLVVAEVTEASISAKTDYSISVPYSLARFPVRDGSCTVRS